MKQFLKTYAVVLLMVEVFLICGGHMLFDFRRRFFVGGAMVALILAVLLQLFLHYENRIEALEKRVAALESQVLTDGEMGIND